MPTEDQSAPRLFFIVTAAFGELFNAMYMTMGCGFNTIFAMPDPMFTLNHSVLPGRSYQFEKLSDLVPVIDKEQPHIVCLFSGYLYIKDKITDFDHLDRLIEHLRQSGIKVITSDPFLGLTGRLPRINPQNPLEQFLSLPMKLAGEMLIGPDFSYMLRAAYSLGRLPHIYVIDPQEGGDAPRLAYFNPYIRCYSAELGDPSNDDLNGQRLSPDRAWWLFILAGSDYWPQVQRDGTAAVHDMLARKLRETREQNKQPVLLAPKPCIEALAADASLSGCIFLDTCDYKRYMALLIGAEYVFYWNIFSASILGRLLNCRPAFFFARGHMADANALMMDKGISRYYAGVKIPYLDQTRALINSELAGLAASHEVEIFRPFLETVRHLPHPRTLIQQFLLNS